MDKKNIKVLVAINNTTVQEEILNILGKKKDFEIETAVDSLSALQVIKLQERYDAAVIDDSFEKKAKQLKILKQIKKDYPDIEIILIVTSGDESDIEAFRKASIRCFSIPLRFEELSLAFELLCIQVRYNHKRKVSDILHKISLDIDSTTEMQEIMDLTCKAAVDILNVDHSGLVIFEKDLSKGIVFAEYPSELQIKGQEIPIRGVPLEETLINEKKIIVIQNVNLDKSLKSKSSSLLKSLLQEFGILSCLFIPVVLNDKVIASFSLDMTSKIRKFYVDEIELCRKFANLVAVAMGKARYMKELSVLNQIGQTLSNSATLNIDEILELIYEQTGRLMDVRNLYIAFYDPGEDMIRFNFVVENGEKMKPGKGDYVDRKAANGLTENIIATKKPLIIKEDMNKELKNRGIAKKGKKAESWVGAPLISEAEVIGVIGVQNFERENVYDDRDMEVLSTIASQAAIAIKNSRLLQERELRYKELNALYDTSLQITQQLELEPLLKSIVKRAAELLDASSGGLMLREGEKAELEMKVTHNLDVLLGVRFEFGQGLVGKVAQSCEPKIVNDYHNWGERDVRFDEPPYKILFRALAVVPMKWQEKVIGVLAISDIAEHKQFNNNDIKILERFANQAAIAYQNATLFNDKVRELEALREADIALLSTMGQDEMLKTILNELSKFVECDLYVIRFWDEEQRELTLGLTKGEYPGKIPARKDISMGISGLAAYKQEPIVSKNVHREPPYKQMLKGIKDTEEQKYLHWIGSEAAVPLIAKKQLVGVLAAIKHTKRGFKENDIRLMEIFARQAAIALHNARLIHRSQQYTTLVSHQLRGPLQAIRGDVDAQIMYIEKKYAQDDKLNHLNRRLGEHFGKIKKELDNFSFLIRDELVGHHRYSMQSDLIYHVIEEAVNQFKEYALERNIKILINASVKDLPRFRFDKENMFNVFTNLIENAVKYSHNNRDVIINSIREGCWIKINVSDYGLGILLKDKERIFELYTQGKLKDERRFVQGTGIGLWVVRQIIKAHGGDIKVWSKLFDYQDTGTKEELEKKGFRTDFTVELPI